MSTWRKKHRRPPPEDKETIHFEPRRDPGKKTHILVKDVVEKWRSPEIVGTKTKRHVTHVSLVLGQENVPPKIASQACWEDHFSVVQDQLKFWMEWIQNIEVGVYKPDQEHDNAEYNTFLEELKNEQDVTATELIQIVKYRPNAPAHKQFNMSCEVVRAPNFCHLCRTVAHPLALCEAKGCTMGSETSISDADDGIEGVELNLRDFHLTRK
ncbi:hypothetical protein OXX80_009974 [Metschnikowia pulcherrima]